MPSPPVAQRTEVREHHAFPVPFAHLPVDDERFLVMLARLREVLFRHVQDGQISQNRSLRAPVSHLPV